MTTPILWYIVSLQCSNCDCQDLPSECTHLFKMLMIIERHMSSWFPMWVITSCRSCGPNVNGWCHKSNRGDECRTIKVEWWKSQIHHIKEVVQWLKQGLGSFDKVVVEYCIRQLAHLMKKLYSLGALSTIHMLETRSISRNQQIGVKRRATLDISQELIGNSPNKTKTHTTRIQRGARRAKRGLPICETEKVQCFHCDCLTNFKGLES